MINGIGSNSFPLQGRTQVARERSDTDRNPATSPEKAPADAWDSLTERRVSGSPSPSDTLIEERLVQHRVEARQAAADARLQRFDADELPLATVRALSTFSAIAASSADQDAGLAGIDIHI
ncbi:hypothetical protein [Marinobacter zhejiangensis]|uniref:UDP pyrophosphate phosphatase n=1 Tax=Marinobacter zhejiangensis TaxID=488535 RepID=A0A1I4N9Z8_9GAMM|nr:hypothetical protein [Marinobacter zhejiangensis]SFM12364.1 hypothetical protein SAMN04487963_1242 [Marinobacter zhejiangensis]